MSDIFTTYWDDAPVPLGVSPQPIRPAGQIATVPVAGAAADQAAIREYVNDERNSRLPASLAAGDWRVRWRVDLPDTLRPAALLATPDRVLVYGADWQLHDHSGRRIAFGPLGNSGVTIDLERRQFYAANQFGLIAARSLLSGQEIFAVSVHEGDLFARTFITRRDRRLITVGYERIVDLHEPPPQRSMVEVTDLGNPASQKTWTDPDGPITIKELLRPSRRLFAAMSGDRLALATENRVYLLDPDLKFHAALTGDFIPLEISLDETGRIYLLVVVGQRTWLWALSPSGEQFYSFNLPEATIAAPPIVGHDHTVYVVSEAFIYAVGQDGKLNWSRRTGGRAAGAVVTGDNQLLTAEGSQIIAWSGKGDRRVLHAFPGESLATAPILIEPGRLLVASDRALYCLTTQ